MNEEEEKKDPEQELKEEIERYERQNQEAYDMQIENEIKRKRQQEERDKKKKDFLDPGSAFRTTAAIGTEVAANTLLDLFSFVPPAQVAGGSLINYLAQKIRGGEISEGEMVAAGLSSLIPGGAQAKSVAGGIAKGVGKGAVSGIVETTGMTTIDEGRLPTVGEVATGAGVGGAFGGLFTTALSNKQVGNALYRLKRRVEGGDFMPLDSGDMLLDVGTVSAAARKPQLTMKNRGIQQVMFFPHENIPNRPNLPTPIGETAQLLAGRTPAGTPQKSRAFKKPGEVDLSKYNWSTPKASANSTNRYERLINDLVEADDISKNDIAKGDLFNIRGKKLLNSTTDSDLATELYTDYLTGYFNKYVRSGIDPYFLNATKLSLVKTSGKTQRMAMQDLLRDLRLYYMNPDEFASDFFGSSKAAKQTRGKAIEDFLTRYRLPKYIGQTVTFEAHHLNVIDEGWPLFVGLPDREVVEMRKLLQKYGIFSGNDPNNIFMLPKPVHVPIIHGIYWPIFRPSWAGRAGDPLKKNILARIPTAKGRENYVKEYATAMQLVNNELDKQLLEYAMKVRGTSRNIGSIANYLSSQAGNVKYTPTKPGEPRYDPRVMVDERYLGRQTSEGRDLTQAEIDKEIQKQIDEQGIYGQGYSPEDPQS